ncbi:hypothetical protein ONS95_003693 [Cadophora gregata]|uniref:uncharacterized protein n=1 Tax=Cadophora gregata TaxID=51156 RepID=UPI0026DB6047|nr:uncharacterized protein ONS95_003693 [Cadophora gregata]KAK0106978.1 hypothetical protein ONS95_003693 [Cadophora gregata]KAK0116668.1 hypothetical protein ONS96_012521 [Cadophora gregata f. sp. sojae]
MARPATHARKRDRAASPLVLKKSPKQPKKPAKVKATAVRSISPSVEGQAAPKDGRNPRTKQTVSAAAIFKKQPKTDRHAKKHRKRREETPEPPEPDLFADLQDGIAEARAAIGDQAKAAFDSVHAGFVERLAAIQADDQEFLENMDAAAKTISGSLEDECVQTAFIEGGKQVKKIHKIGDRVAAFKSIVEKEEAKLADLWKQWDDVQDEYRELGIDIFGREAFGVDSPGHDKGFFREMKLLALEHETRVNELEEEIEGVGMDIMKKIKASEKDWATTTKKDHQRFLQNLIMP